VAFLDGLTVVSLEQAVAAPFATRQLADLGARVIKVERPGGDFARRYDTVIHGQSSYFVWLNRGKESIELDLKDAQARMVLDTLLERADVFVQNLAPGAAARLGLDADGLGSRFPRLIRCDISGYGGDGPDRDRKAYDLLIQCEAGLLSVTGTENELCRVGVSIADIAAGMYAYSGILAALYERERTGEARAIAVSMLEALGEWMTQPAYYAAYGPNPPPRSGPRHPTVAPYGPFAARDGELVFLAVQNEAEWERLVTRVVARPELARDARFATNSARVANRSALEEIIGGACARLARAELVAALDDAGIASARVNDLAAFWTHPQLEARRRWTEIGIPGASARALLPPVDFSGYRPRMGDVPATGEHTARILAELAMEADA
jgi:itaconate CoA-transferase